MDMKYGVILVAFILVVVIIVLMMVKLEPVDSSGDNLGGDTSSYIDPLTCPTQAQSVITDNELTKIHACEAEAIKLGYETAYIVKILYGPGMDCPSGCIYASYNAVVFPDNSYRQITDSGFAYPDIRAYIWEKTSLPISDVDRISSKELTYYKDDLAIKYTFYEYLRGDVYVVENQPIQGHITPTGMTVEQAENIAIQELRKEGKIMHSNYQISPHYLGDRDCWSFHVGTEGVNPIKCNVIVCLDGTVDVSC